MQFNDNSELAFIELPYTSTWPTWR